MDRDVLARVVEFERKLHARLEQERSEAALWLADFRATLNSSVEGRARQLSEQSVRESERATEEAMREATHEVEHARAMAARLEALDEATLAPIILDALKQAVLGRKP